MRLLVTAGVVAASVATAAAGVVPQQRGNACAAVWDLGLADATPGAKRRHPWALECTDGDPVCDTDGFVDGTCRVAVRACVEQSTFADCRPMRVKRLRLAPDTAALLPDLVLPALGQGAACGSEAVVQVPTSSASSTVTLTLRSRSRGRTGRSRVAIGCRPGIPTGSVCPNVLPGRPARARVTLQRSGSDVDYGTSGQAHDFPFVEGAAFDLCLSECDGAADPACSVAAPAPTRVAPLPFLTNSVTACVHPRVETPFTGALDVATGALELNGTLAADVYGLQPLDSVCPRCSGDGTVGSVGACNRGRNRDEPCTVDVVAQVLGANPSVHQLSSDCLPEGQPVTTLTMPLVLSTGERRLDGSRPCPGQIPDDECGAGSCTLDCSQTPAPKGGIGQTCCSDNASLPCFPTATDSAGTLVRTGVAAALTPPLPDAAYPKHGNGVLAQVGCVGRTTDLSVDILSGLPGPTAWLLPFTLTIAAD